jgi:hypothetical protein
MDDEWDPAIMVEHLKNYESVYRGSPEEILAYTVKQYLLYAIHKGEPDVVLKDPKLQSLFGKAQLATSCGWTPYNSAADSK